MPSSDILRQVTAWSSLGIRSTWTVSEVRAALQQHADGNFSQSALLADSFGEDDVLPGVLEKRVDAVLGSDFALNPVDAPNKQLSKRIVDQYGPVWWDMFPESELAELLSWYCMLGVAVAVLDWERGGSKWTARLRVLHPQFLRFDHFRNVWIYSAKEGELVVTPGDGKWILLTDGQRGYMRGAVRALAITWIAKQLTIRDWNRYNERHGLPIIKAFAPAIADDEDQEQFWSDVKAIQSETVAQLPTDLGDKGARFDLELLEAKDGSWQSFKELLDRCDRRIMVHILGSNLATEVSGAGSLAATKVHRGVEISKATAGGQKLSTEIRQQGLFPIVSYNLAGVSTIDVIPWPRWDTAPPEDDAANATAAETFGKALVQISLAGYQVKNLDALAERYGLELEPKPEPKPLALPAPPALLSAFEPPDDDEPSDSIVKRATLTA